jgi:methylmalonyl-CoA epimerase
MKAVLDHVGIAVSDLDAALRFYRDGLGLEVEKPEDVPTQQVRAHFMPAGQSSLELLEPTAPASPIAKFVDKRGPGLHHITLRVDDIHEALARLKSRGVTLIDQQPRPGAEESLVAFIHPSSAQGVLVELKQTGVAPRTEHPAPVIRFSLGNFELISVSDGFFRLDGGSMFGVVPKTMWAPVAPPDDRNRILLSMRPLVIRGARTMIVDAGMGDKESERFHQIYGVERAPNHLDRSLAEAGLAPDDIDIVLASHLHFDHAGGFTDRDAAGRLRPHFPRAQYVVRRGEWEDAMHPSARTRASYLVDNYAPLADAGVLQLVDEDQTIMPGVRVRRTGGHTPHHQMIIIESSGKTAAFVADLMPTTAHLPDVWVMGYDLFPMESMAAKQQFVKEAIEQNVLVFFEHDPVLAAGYLREEGGKRSVRQPTTKN